MSLLKACNGGTPAPVDLTQGLVAHYLLNNNADDIAGTYDGTPSGGVDFQGDMADFDGVDGIIETTFPTLVNNSTYTFSFWFISSIAQDALLVEQLISFYNFSFTYDHYNTLIQGDFGLRDSSGTWLNGDSSNTLLKDTLYHITIVINNTTITLYINTVASSSLTWDGTFYATEGTPMNIGATISPTSSTINMFNGKVSNIRAYNEAKDQTFIDALYAEGYYPKPLPLPTTDGLIAHYPLTGTAEDATGNYDGTEVGGLTYIDNAEKGSVAKFDGLDDYIELGTIPIGHPLQLVGGATISFWAIPTFTGDDYARVIDKSDGGSGAHGYSIYFVQSTKSIQFVGGNGTVITSSSICAISAYENKMTNFIITIPANGVPEISANNTVLTPTSFDSGSIVDFQTNMRIGTWNHSTGREYNSVLGDIRFYGKVLTTQEKTDIYNYEKNFRPIDIDDGLVAYYPLANNSLDNYYNEYDGVDTSMSYDGLSGNFTLTDAKVSNASMALGITKNFTISAWVKLNTVVANEVGVLSVNRDGNTSTIIRIKTHSNSEIRCSFLDSTLTYSVTVRVIPTNVYEWNHVLYTYDGSNVSLYLNGVLVDTLAETSTPYAVNSMTIGDYPDVGDFDIDGFIAKARIYNKETTKERTEAIYNTEKGDFE